MKSDDNQTTGDKKLDRRILRWKIILEVYTAIVITYIAYLLERLT